MIDFKLLKVDIDRPRRQYEEMVFEAAVKKICEITTLSYTGIEFSTSKSGNMHAKVSFKEDLEPMEALFLQCWLGDDPLRSLFNFRRIRRGQLNWNILFGDDTR